MLDERDKKAFKLDSFKYPLIVLILGVVLMLVPGRTSELGSSETDNPLEAVLSCTLGVGRAEVIVSDSGVVVVCDGAEDARVRLDIIRAVSSYTGFASDKITILKMTQ